jgi:hypothetical protein
MSRLNPNARIAIFVGDGLSDRYAAGCADVVFAKDALSAYCDERAIAYTPYGDLGLVAQKLEGLADVLTCQAERPVLGGARRLEIANCQLSIDNFDFKE